MGRGTCESESVIVRTLIGMGVALLATWLVLLIALAINRPQADLVREALRLLPDVLRLLRRLSADMSLPRGVRARLWLLLLYLAVPIDLVPDFIPVLGYADDAILVIWALRSVIRHAGPEALERHWHGSPNGLAAVMRVCGAKAQ